ncbi:unnamed protein product [Leptidea sinapis]|uniref:Uncharacterized protein n=1 Tax=Leptidea sinapis TaxID=189913 RepID=A0A5E4Q8S7_9NEOP|nr:unnamed protein product [Leptidea sinapis]
MQSLVNLPLLYTMHRTREVIPCAETSNRFRRAEPGPPARPSIPQRLIVVPDPQAQQPNRYRPLPPTPKSSGSSNSSERSNNGTPPSSGPQPPQRGSHHMFKPMDLDKLAAQLNELSVDHP